MEETPWATTEDLRQSGISLSTMYEHDTNVLSQRSSTCTATATRASTFLDPSSVRDVKRLHGVFLVVFFDLVHELTDLRCRISGVVPYRQT
jgi:hypothetical protein